MDQHELVCRLKELAIELGRTPTRNEFFSRVPGGDAGIRHYFNRSYNLLVTASGLEPNITKKIDNSIFEKSIDRHLEDYQEKPPQKKGPWPRLAVISDIHWPFHSQRVIDAFYRFVEREKPEHVIINGDARDFLSHSRFPRSHNVFTPREENASARKFNEKFWEEIQKICPDAKKKQLLGNHCIRPMKQTLEHYPEAEDWIAEAMKREFTFPGVDTIFDHREEFILGDIMIVHGYRSKLGDHRDFSLYNSIVGHTHKGGCVFKHIRGQTLWELNSGYAGDPNAKGLSYTPQKISDWTPGFAFVDADGPRFVPV